MSMTYAEAVERIAVWKFIPDGWEVPLGFDQVVAQAKEALAVLREALAEYDVSEKAWDIKQRQLEQMTAEVERLKKFICDGEGRDATVLLHQAGVMAELATDRCRLIAENNCLKANHAVLAPAPPAPTDNSPLANAFRGINENIKKGKVDEERKEMLDWLNKKRTYLIDELALSNLAWAEDELDTVNKIIALILSAPKRKNLSEGEEAAAGNAMSAGDITKGADRTESPSNLIPAPKVVSRNALESAIDTYHITGPHSPFILEEDIPRFLYRLGLAVEPEEGKEKP